MKLKATTAVVSNSRAMALKPLQINMAMTSATAVLSSITINTAAINKVNTMVPTKASTATSHVMAVLSTIKDTDNKVATNPTSKAMVSLSSP